MLEPATSHPMRGKSIEQCRSEGAAMVAAWRESGLSMRAYAREHGLNERRLGLWRRKLEAELSPESAEGFIPVTVSDTDTLVVVVNDHVKIEVHTQSDMTLLRRTVSALTC